MNTRYTTKDWTDLVTIQNHHFINQDILTITGFMDDSELAEHVQRYRELAAEKEKST
jgi:hypothetical protein